MKQVRKRPSSVETWWHKWRPGGEVKGKLVNEAGSQYPSHYLGTWCIQHYYCWCAHLGCQYSTELTPPPADLNGLVRFAERRNLISARVPSHFKSSLTLLALSLCYYPSSVPRQPPPPSPPPVGYISNRFRVHNARFSCVDSHRFLRPQLELQRMQSLSPL
jgi:hypothetical protein